MKNLTFTLLVILIFNSQNAQANLYNKNIKSAKGELIKLSDFKGKSILFVNIATKCGYTGQLDGLESLYKKKSKKDFAIIGIPSNDFGSQTPERNEDVAKFCRLKYGVSFPITTKTPVSGKEAHELVSYIIESSGGDKIAWNFEKFLFNKKGEFVKRFKSATTPESKELLEAIDSTL